MSQAGPGIQGNAIYSTRDLRAIGIGDAELMRARQAGVKPRKIGRWLWYHGQELIDWILTRPEFVTERDAKS
jgi:hypothetical protein